MKASAWPTVGRNMSPRGSFGFGSRAMTQVVAAVADVRAAEVDGLGVAVEGGAHVLGRVGLHALAPAPHDVDLGAQLGAEVDGVERLGHRVAPHLRVVGGERAVLEHRAGVNRLVVAIGTFMPVSSRAWRKRFTMASRSRGRRAEGHEVVVVEVDAVGAELGQPVHRLDRVERRPHLVAERIAARVADGPQTEGEVVLGLGLELGAVGTCVRCS